MNWIQKELNDIKKQLEDKDLTVSIAIIGIFGLFIVELLIIVMINAMLLTFDININTGLVLLLILIIPIIIGEILWWNIPHKIKSNESAFNYTAVRKPKIIFVGSIIQVLATILLPALIIILPFAVFVWINSLAVKKKVTK
jgi:hypothetical protein